MEAGACAGILSSCQSAFLLKIERKLTRMHTDGLSFHPIGVRQLVVNSSENGRGYVPVINDKSTPLTFNNRIKLPERKHGRRPKSSASTAEQPDDIGLGNYHASSGDQHETFPSAVRSSGTSASSKRDDAPTGSLSQVEPTVARRANNVQETRR